MGFLFHFVLFLCKGNKEFVLLDNIKTLKIKSKRKARSFTFLNFPPQLPYGFVQLEPC